MLRLQNKEIRAMEDETVRMHAVLTDLYPSFQRFDASFNQLYPTVDDFLYVMLYKNYNQRIKKISEKYESFSGKSHLWVGINPPQEKYTLIELYQHMQEVTNRPKIAFFREGYMWSIEQNTSGGVRPHIHLMLLDTKVKPSRVIETLAKSFDLAKNSIECKRHFADHLYNVHIDYIKGIKTEEKDENVKKDKQDRETLGIPDYINNI